MEERPQPHAQRGAEPVAQPANTAVPSATFSISPPEAFDFAKPQEWQKWIRRFERFRVASNLDKSSEDNQGKLKDSFKNRAKLGKRHKVEQSSSHAQNVGKYLPMLNFSAQLKMQIATTVVKEATMAGCANQKRLSAVTEDSAMFLGIVDAGEEPWTVDIGVRHTKVAFKIDTGADVTVMPEQVYREIAQGSTRSLTPGKKALFGPGLTPLTVLGLAREVLQCGDRSTTEDIYVLKHLKAVLLSRPASVRLRLNTAKVHKKLKPDTKAVSLKVPRRVPLPLMGKVKKELERMEQLGVISRIEEPTEWCSGMVVAPKKSGEIRICVDLSPLNNACAEKSSSFPQLTRPWACCQTQ
ncbi:hypothetical protein SKAU_G00135900 [Synaphobranchus kaupii]|uniref:Peptidase A2 domain-containing protein n=1 Tax=Synaphobranchus kaupii TaxID=118154 RepID=A0A9Q1J2T9_SYNKA|nr:hypothetical protein SKAU_G00135900 [Synaphobranchus kaupii]